MPTTLLTTRETSMGQPSDGLSCPTPVLAIALYISRLSFLFLKQLRTIGTQDRRHCQRHAAHILADTGASLTLVSSNFVRKYCINIKLADQPTTIHGVGGHQLPITNQATLDICIGQQVLPPIEALVADIVDFDLILSYDCYSS